MTALEHRLASLQRAQASRLKRSRLRRRLHDLGRRDGAREAMRVLVQEGDQYPNIEIGDFLLMIPGVGQRKCRQLLSRLELSPWRPIRELSQGRREQVAEGIEEILRRRFW
jgi:hypothetical protein